MQLTEKDLKGRRKLAEQSAEFQKATPGERAAREALLALPPAVRQTIILWRKQHKKTPIPGVKL